MKLKVLTTCHHQSHPGYQRLKASLDKFGYDYECITHPFTFGKQMLIIRDWAKNYTGDCTHFLYTDAFDTIAFAEPGEVLRKYNALSGIECKYKMLISCEKACYPHPERAKDYPESSTPWKYVNGGGWIVEIEYFKKLCETLNDQSHDQVWLMDTFLNNQDEISLDTHCDIFQTIAFSLPEEWEKVKVPATTPGNELPGNETEIRFKNIGTGTLPVFFHGNGHTEMNWLTL